MTKKVYDFSAKKKIWFLIPLILIVGIIVFTVIRGPRNHTEGREPFRKRRYVFNFFQL